jgi:hypothetical protein
MGRLLQSKWLLWAAVLCITAALGWMDWLTGRRLSFFAFYFIPVGIAAWHLGLGGMIISSIICTGVWFGSDALSGAAYDSHVHPVWNTMMRLCAFLAVGWPLHRLRRLLISEKDKTSALERSLAEIKVLKGILPICAQCKRIRDDEGRWQQMERYISRHSGAQFTHGYCPECAEALLAEAGLIKAK